ncbi:MAG: GAF domain-containing protein [Actinobacteria bacterium]|nr:GAF domain-containing protein [Actinomycetota bacterium]
MAETRQLCPAMLGVAKAIASAANLPAVLQLIAENTVNLTGAKASSVFLLDASGRRLNIAVAFGLSDEFLKKGPIELDDDPISAEVLRGKTITIADISSDPRVLFGSDYLSFGIAALTAVEIAAGERPLGVMNLYKSTPGSFSKDDMDVLMTMASFGSVGVESARVYDRLYRRCADLSVLNQVAEDINVSLRTNEVIDAIVSEVPKVLNAKACSIRLYDQSTRTMRPVAAYGLKKGLLEKGTINLEDAPIDEEALKGQVVVVSDIATDRRWRYPERALEEGIASAMIAPMIIKGKPVGTLRIYSKEPREFTEEERSLLLAIARHSAIAIENARLYELSVKTHDQLVQDVWRGLPDVWGTITGKREAA